MQLNIWDTFSKGHLLFEFCSSIPLPSQVNKLSVSKLLCNHTLITHLFFQAHPPQVAIKLAGCTYLVSMHHESSTLAQNKRALHAKATVKEHHYEKKLSFEDMRCPHTLLLYCLEQWGQQTGGVAIVPVSWVWVLSMGSGSPGPAGRSFRMLGGSSAPGWFFRIWALRLLALLYTWRVMIGVTSF